MVRRLRLPALALVLAGAMGGSWAQGGASIYTCVDAQGRRQTSDRPIRDCLDREQKELNPSGTVRRVVPPSLTGPERAALEERQRQATDERMRQEEDRRMQRALLLRYPNQAAHDSERAKALEAIGDVIASGQRHLAELQEQRKAIDAEAEFYKTQEQWPARLKRQLATHEEQVAAQHRLIAGQQEEKNRIDARFDDELARLRVLWVRGLAAAPAAAPPAR